jgi:hypothetical protein
MRKLLQYTLEPQTPGYVEYRGKISRLCSGRKSPKDDSRLDLWSSYQIFNRAGQRYPSPDTPPHSALSIFKDLWLPSFLQFRFPARLLFRLPYFRFYSLSRPENLALQIKTSTLLRIIDIKQLLESRCHIFHIRFPILWRLDIQDLACLFQRQPMGGECVCCIWIVLCLRFGVL